MANFPPLRMAVLTGLIGLKDHLDTLDAADCPYDEETKKALRDILAPKTVDRVVEKEVFVEQKNGRGRPTKDIKLSEEDQQMVLDEIKTTLAELRQLGTGEGQLDTAARIQISKTKADQLERLLKMQERWTTVQKMQQFIEDIIAILDDFMNEADREAIMRRLEPFR